MTTVASANHSTHKLVQSLQSPNSDERIAAYRQLCGNLSYREFLLVLPALIRVIVRIAEEKDCTIRSTEPPGCPMCAEEWIGYEERELFRALSSSAFVSAVIPELLKTLESSDISDKGKVGIVFALGNVIGANGCDDGIIEKLKNVAMQTSYPPLGVAVVDVLRSLYLDAKYSGNRF